MFLEPITLEEIITIVSTLNNNATGFDEINAEYLKCPGRVLLILWCHIYMSLLESVFSKQLKTAFAVPLHKCSYWSHVVLPLSTYLFIVYIIKSLWKS